MTGVEHIRTTRRAVGRGEVEHARPQRVLEDALASGSLYLLRSSDVRRVDYWVSATELLLVPFVRDADAAVDATVSESAAAVLAWADLVATRASAAGPAVELPHFSSANDVVRWFAAGRAATATGVLLLIEDGDGLAAFARVDDGEGSHVVFAAPAAASNRANDAVTILDALLRPIAHIQVPLAVRP